MSPIPSGPMSRSLEDWLAHLEHLHPKTIELGLDRVHAVYGRLGTAMRCPVITVTGTNGKGSTSAMLESVYRAAGFRTGLYTSPHLLHYNERVRLDGVDASDTILCEGFAAVEAVRGDVPLTQFEFGTLAALWCFARAPLDVLVLEVGLGGRLDAVNVIDADVAVLTSVGIDHVDYLGSSREEIGREKAGIFRAGRPAICGDRSPPETVEQRAGEIGAELWRIGRDFDFALHDSQWDYLGRSESRRALAHPALRGRFQIGNATVALATIEALGRRLPVPMGAVRAGLATVEWPARFQVLPGRPTVVLDVAHNPHAAHVLAECLGSMGYHPVTIAVLGMLGDKDIAGVVAEMKPRIDRWCIAPLVSPRAGPIAALRAVLESAGVDPDSICECAGPEQAFARARGIAAEADRIVVFGSFLTVAAVMAAVKRERASGS